MENVWENVYLVVLVFWPGVVVGAALLNMLVSWVFSWSELIIDYMIGVVIGLCFFYCCTNPDPEMWKWYESLFLIASHGLFGILKIARVEWLLDPGNFFLVSSLCIGGAVLITAALDHASAALGDSGGGVGFSFLVVLFKAPFTLITTVLGVVIGVIGLIYGKATNDDQEFTFLGGALFFKWGMSGVHATTFGWAVNVFKGGITSNNILPHELYHTRQYIYLKDWLGIFYFTVAGLYGIISAAISSVPFSGTYFFQAHGTQEVGNPLECAAYRKWPPTS